MSGLLRIHLDDDLAGALDLWRISDFGEDPPRYYARRGPGATGRAPAPLEVTVAVGADLVAVMRSYADQWGPDSVWAERADRLEDLIAAACRAGVTL